jgi:hypothetical protein
LSWSRASINYHRIASRVRRQLSTIYLRVEIREDPPPQLSMNSNTSNISNWTSQIINRYQSGETNEEWRNHSATNGVIPTSMSIQEPESQTSVSLSIISRVALVKAPASCREQAPCDQQPVLIAYDASGNVIEKLGSNSQPWQIVASIVGQPNMQVIGAIANYIDGKSQFTNFGVSSIGTYQIQFRFITPNGVNR